jgi:hypothetical protein
VKRLTNLSFTEGECRKCSCGGWHKEANCTKGKGALNGPQQDAEFGSQPPAMDRSEVLQELSCRVATEHGIHALDWLRQQGDRRGHRPWLQQETESEQQHQTMDQMGVLQELSRRVRTEHGIEALTMLMDASARSGHSQWQQELHNNMQPSEDKWGDFKVVPTLLAISRSQPG